MLSVAGVSQGRNRVIRLRTSRIITKIEPSNIEPSSISNIALLCAGAHLYMTYCRRRVAVLRGSLCVSTTGGEESIY